MDKEKQAAKDAILAQLGNKAEADAARGKQPKLTKAQQASVTAARSNQKKLEEQAPKQRRPRIKQPKEVRRAKRKARRAAAEVAATVQPAVIIKAALKGKARVDRPYVARTNGPNDEWGGSHVAIVLRRAVSRVFVIHMDAAGIRVTGESIDRFDRHFVPLEYDVQGAARRFLTHGTNLVGITDVARDALNAIIQGEVNMQQIDESAVDGQAEPTTPKASTKSGTTAKSKKASKVKSTKGKGKKSADKEPKEKKAKSKKKKEGGGPHLDPDLKIKKMSKENPRRSGTNRAKRYDAYRDGMTVGKALENSHVKAIGIRQDVDDGLIKLSK